MLEVEALGHRSEPGKASCVRQFAVCLDVIIQTSPPQSVHLEIEQKRVYHTGNHLLRSIEVTDLHSALLEQL